MATSTQVTLQVQGDLPELTAAQGLTGWRREFCVELAGDGVARIHVRAVERSAMKAAELQRATLFHRLEGRFSDLAGCIERLRPDLERLASTARRAPPDRHNLFITLAYDRSAWERIVDGLDRWGRGAH